MKAPNRQRPSRAASIIEYMTLIVFILTAFFVLKNYILKGFLGRWKATGDTFGHGRQYDPRPYGVKGTGGGTLECRYDNNTNKWISVRCFEQTCSDNCESFYDTSGDCESCIIGCNQDNALYADCAD